jgi:hypothetical protein
LIGSDGVSLFIITFKVVCEGAKEYQMKCKVLKAVGATILSVVFFGNAANAALIDRGNGMIYDDVLNITWLQEPGLTGMSSSSYYTAKDRADTLEFGGYDDWRIPGNNAAAQRNGNCLYANRGINCSYNPLSSKSELAYMFHVNLGNVVNANEYGSPGIPGWVFNDSFIDGRTGDLVSFIGAYRAYWQDTNLAMDGTYGVSMFNMSYGINYETVFGAANWSYSTWAVRDGDVNQVPIPSTITIFALGIIGLVLRRFKKQAY